MGNSGNMVQDQAQPDFSGFQAKSRLAMKRDG
jgi:hypothetical protein